MPRRRLEDEKMCVLLLCSGHSISKSHRFLSKVVVIKEESPKFFGLPAALLLTEGHILKKSFYAKQLYDMVSEELCLNFLRSSILRAEP